MGQYVEFLRRKKNNIQFSAFCVCLLLLQNIEAKDPFGFRLVKRELGDKCLGEGNTVESLVGLF